MYEIDELAGIVAMAGEKEQAALTADIAKNGQQEPAVLWRGKIVDGRCRQLACITLSKELKVRKLDDTLSRDEVASIVKSLNTRRNLTVTQKLMSAIAQQERTNETNDAIAEQWAVGVASLKNAKYIKKHAPELVDNLFNGKSIKVYDLDKGFEITTNKINTIARLVKKNKEATTVVEDNSEVIEYTVDGVLKTEVAKEWYYGTVASLNIPDKGTRIAVNLLLVELANLKFKEML